MTTPIDWQAVTACGECCTGCSKKKAGQCKGCIETDGHCEEWTHSVRCPIHTCAKKHRVQFCGLCEEFPCQWLLAKVTWKADLVEEHKLLATLYQEDFA